MIQLFHSQIAAKTNISLPASKSESNRLLIIQALSKDPIKIKNLSEARDTQTLFRLLQSDAETLDVLDAGTTMRFLTAYLSVTNRKAILTGTERMQQRPIGILTDALKQLGAEIEFINKEGYPPLRILGFKNQLSEQLKVRGDISSQYISALLMIAPVLPLGLKVDLMGKVGSRPYIEMTLGLMEKFGVRADVDDTSINIKPQNYKGGEYVVESDWSAASYWYSLLALSQMGEILLKGLRPNSFQADIQIALIMDKLGVGSEFRSEGVRIYKKNPGLFNFFDFTHCPDIAQTVAVTCAALGRSCTFTGLESLRIKETDRIAALQTELAKIGARLEEHRGEWNLIPSEKLPSKAEFHAYDDHRMAMAFAPLAALMNLSIDDEKVVVKSYPRFWDDLKSAGIQLNFG